MTGPDVTQPLRLAVGSHQAGSGKGCAMNVISWENGDATITDLPKCSDPFLARVVQSVNDSICTHRTEDLLCPECSVKVLDLGHRTVGTFTPDIDPKVYVTIAVEQAESVLPLSSGDAPRRACALVRRFLVGEVVTRDELRAAANAAYAHAVYAANAAVYAANAAAYAAHAAAYAAYAAAHAAHAANAAANAAAAAHAAAYAAHAGQQRLTYAHHIINRFLDLTGTQTVDVPNEVTARAVAAMVQPPLIFSGPRHVAPLRDTAHPRPAARRNQPNKPNPGRVASA